MIIKYTGRRVYTRPVRYYYYKWVLYYYILYIIGYLPTTFIFVFFQHHLLLRTRAYFTRTFTLVCYRYSIRSSSSPRSQQYQNGRAQVHVHRSPFVVHSRVDDQKSLLYLYRSQLFSVKT